ncbi:MarR family transcriptional regulator [Pseudoclavibacter endophyticus]|uniref:MarR family transcriptional regulator n=1 Tax=Pseudoclavibacter endophyticus TaxID=1778590 RepID=A0A6H9WPC8_9MICO|nr:MarR family transcriptional regulator [Pseudoclavibacter endophyticus]KAB1649591.1 MarR family transcriptional regulator [Pseudoclavibacter endophyticus]GGA61408.1 MarR family transcriptional regulator [Pseudoclavibacter endophyticus]
MQQHSGHEGAVDAVDAIVRDWERERPDLDVDPLRIFSRVKRIAKQLDTVRKSAFAATGLELWEFDVLAALRRAGAPHRLSPKQLLAITLVSSGTMTNRLDRLAARGLVRREADPHDGRGVLVTMTDAGRVRVDEALTRLVAAERQLLEDLDPESRDGLADSLRRLTVAMEIDEHDERVRP